MHIPDGFINASTSLGAGVAAAGGLGTALRRTARELGERQAPLAGVVTAFVFAAQMVNFPVAAGTSGHLLGAVLASVLVGPWTAAVCLSVVLIVQALLFADGGLTALGLNIVNISFVATFAGWAIFAVLRSLRPHSRSWLTTCAGIAAGVSVPISSMAFVAEYAIGGTSGAPVGLVAWAMLGVHSLIGLGEGVITAFTVGAVLNARADLVYGAVRLRAATVAA